MGIFTLKSQFKRGGKTKMTESERLIELVKEYHFENGGIVLPCEEVEKALHKIKHNSLCETETYKVDK